VSRAAAAAGSALFFLLAPGVAAGLVPYLLTGYESEYVPLPMRVAGALLAVAGLAAVVTAFARFVSEGIGTPAPVAPPQRFVVGGLYRYVRNPMYVAVAAMIAGQALILGRPVLLPYLAAFCLAVVAFVHWYEEPNLARRFGREFEAYRSAVPGWWPRTRPWDPER
jgi:protein-S-isoprenylcysteine O-methyltransferase Ste14